MESAFPALSRGGRGLAPGVSLGEGQGGDQEVVEREA